MKSQTLRNDKDYFEVFYLYSRNRAFCVIDMRFYAVVTWLLFLDLSRVYS